MASRINADFSLGVVGNNVSTFTDTTSNAWAKYSSGTVDGDFKFATIDSVVRLQCSGTAGHPSIAYANVVISDTAYDAICEIHVHSVTTANTSGLFIAKQATGLQWLELTYDASTGDIACAKWTTGGGYTKLNSTLTVSRTAGQKLWFKLSRVDATTVHAYYSTTSGTGPWTDVTTDFTLDATLQANGYAGVRGYQVGTTNPDTMIDWMTVDSTGGLSVTDPAIAAIRDNAIVYSVSISNGTAPYTVQHYYDTTNRFTGPSGGATLITGQTTTTCTFTSGVAGQVYAFWTKVTDSASNTVTSNPVTAVYADRPPICLMCIGTSHTSYDPSDGDPFPTWIGRYLPLMFGYKTVVVSNQGVGSSYTNLWAPASSNLVTAMAAGNAAAAAMSATRQKWCLFEHGFNDANNPLNDSDNPNGVKTVADFQTRCAAIFAVLVADGWKIVFPYPVYSWLTTATGKTGTELDTSNRQRKAYQAAVDALVDNVNIFKGATEMFDWMGANSARLPNDNGVHPDGAATQYGYGLFHSKAIGAAIDLANGYSTGGPLPSIGSSPFIRSQL